LGYFWQNSIENETFSKQYVHTFSFSTYVSFSDGFASFNIFKKSFRLTLFIIQILLYCGMLMQSHAKNVRSILYSLFSAILTLCHWKLAFFLDNLWYENFFSKNACWYKKSPTFPPFFSENIFKNHSPSWRFYSIDLVRSCVFFCSPTQSCVKLMWMLALCDGSRKFAIKKDPNLERATR
jgi:hypothetical protein